MGSLERTTQDLRTSSAIEIIRQNCIDGATRYTLCQDAVSALQCMGSDQPIAIVSIAGIYRKGKSYILNRLVKSKSAFKVSDGADSCTRGIWMCPEPISIHGKEHRLVRKSTLSYRDASRSQQS